MPCCNLPLLLKVIPKACLLVLLFLFLVWFWITFHISPPCPSAPLCMSPPPCCGLPSPPLQNHRLKKLLISHLQEQPFSFCLPVTLVMHRSCLACAAPPPVQLPECPLKRPLLVVSLHPFPQGNEHLWFLLSVFWFLSEWSLVNYDSWFHTLQPIKCFLRATAGLCILSSFGLQRLLSATSYQ